MASSTHQPQDEQALVYPEFAHLATASPEPSRIPDTVRTGATSIRERRYGQILPAMFSVLDGAAPASPSSNPYFDSAVTPVESPFPQMPGAFSPYLQPTPLSQEAPELRRQPPPPASPAPPLSFPNNAAAFAGPSTAPTTTQEQHLGHSKSARKAIQRRSAPDADRLGADTPHPAGPHRRHSFHPVQDPIYSSTAQAPELHSPIALARSQSLSLSSDRGPGSMDPQISNSNSINRRAPVDVNGQRPRPYYAYPPPVAVTSGRFPLEAENSPPLACLSAPPEEREEDERDYTQFGAAAVRQVRPTPAPPSHRRQNGQSRFREEMDIDGPAHYAAHVTARRPLRVTNNCESDEEEEELDWRNVPMRKGPDNGVTFHSNTPMASLKLGRRSDSLDPGVESAETLVGNAPFPPKDYLKRGDKKREDAQGESKGSRCGKLRIFALKVGQGVRHALRVCRKKVARGFGKLSARK